MGSGLYGNRRSFHDLDATLITKGGTSRDPAKYAMIGDLDLRIISAESLTDRARLGNLQDCEALWAIQRGHGAILDESWRPLLLGLRPSLSAYARKSGSVERPKHAIRLAIFIERAIRTGDTDPRLRDDELGLYFERLDEAEHASGGRPHGK